MTCGRVFARRAGAAAGAFRRGYANEGFGFSRTHARPSVMTTLSSRNTATPVTLLKGDGIGPELTAAVVEVFDAAKVPVVWEEVKLSSSQALNALSPADLIPDDVVASIRKTGACLKGPLFAPSFSGHKSLDFALAQKFGLFAHVTHCRNTPGIKTRHDGMDLVIIREYTEGLHLGHEHMPVPNVVESIQISTKVACMRIANYAFEFALRTGRKKVTAIHKANIMKLCDGMFLQCCSDVAKNYPTIKFESMIVDNCSMQLVSDPTKFDVLVLPNFFGTIIGNLAASLVGGPGVVPGWTTANSGPVIFEQGTRHVANDIAGKNLANPTALLLSSCVMLRHLGHHWHADMIETAVTKVHREGKVRTKDIGGSSTCSDFTKAVIDNFEMK